MSDNFITLEEAYDSATKFFRSIQYQTTFANNSQLTLEEFEFVKSLKCWFITLGFVPVQREEIEEQYTTPRREYRIFQLDSVTGKVKSMKKGFMGHQEENAINVSSQEPNLETDWVRIIKEITERQEK